VLNKTRRKHSNITTHSGVPGNQFYCGHPVSWLRLQGILSLLSDKLCRDSGLLRRKLWRRMMSFRRFEKSYSLNVQGPSA